MARRYGRRGPRAPGLYRRLLAAPGPAPGRLLAHVHSHVNVAISCHVDGAFDEEIENRRPAVHVARRLVTQQAGPLRRSDDPRSPNSRAGERGPVQATSSRPGPNRPARAARARPAGSRRRWSPGWSEGGALDLVLGFHAARFRDRHYFVQRQLRENGRATPRRRFPACCSAPSGPRRASGTWGERPVPTPGGREVRCPRRAPVLPSGRSWWDRTPP